METVFNSRRNHRRTGVYQTTPYGTPPLRRQSSVDGLHFLGSHPSSSCSGSSSWVLWRDQGPAYPDTRRRRGRLCSVLLALAVLFVVLTVLAIAALAVYMGALRIDTSKPELIFDGSVRIVSEDRFIPALTNSSSTIFKEKALKYQTLIESVYHKSVLRSAFRRCTVERFENGSLVVFFRLSLDRRKIPRSMLNVEETAREILVQEVTSLKPVAFRNVLVDTNSIYIRRFLEDTVQPATYQREEDESAKSKSEEDRTLEIHNGVLRKAPARPEMPSQQQPATNVTPEVVPVIEGSYTITKSEASLTEKNNEVRPKKPLGMAIVVNAPEKTQDSITTESTTEAYPVTRPTSDKSHHIPVKLPNNEWTGQIVQHQSSLNIKEPEIKNTTQGVPPEHDNDETDILSYSDPNLYFVSTKEVPDVSDPQQMLSKRVGEIYRERESIVTHVGDKTEINKQGAISNQSSLLLDNVGLTTNPIVLRTNTYNDRYKHHNLPLDLKSQLGNMGFPISANKDLKHANTHDQPKVESTTSKWRPHDRFNNHDLAATQTIEVDRRPTLSTLPPHVTEEPWKPIVTRFLESLATSTNSPHQGPAIEPIFLPENIKGPGVSTVFLPGDFQQGTGVAEVMVMPPSLYDIDSEARRPPATDTKHNMRHRPQTSTGKPHFDADITDYASRVGQEAFKPQYHEHIFNGTLHPQRSPQLKSSDSFPDDKLSTISLHITGAGVGSDNISILQTNSSGGIIVRKNNHTETVTKPTLTHVHTEKPFHAVIRPNVLHKRTDTSTIPRLPLLQQFPQLDSLIKANVPIKSISASSIRRKPPTSTPTEIPPNVHNGNTNDTQTATSSQGNNTGQQSGLNMKSTNQHMEEPQVSNLQHSTTNSSVASVDLLHTSTPNNSIPIHVKNKNLSSINYHKSSQNNSDIILEPHRVDSVQNKSMEPTGNPVLDKVQLIFKAEPTIPVLPPEGGSSTPFPASNTLHSDLNVTEGATQLPLITLLPVRSYLGRPLRPRPKLPQPIKNEEKEIAEQISPSLVSHNQATKEETPVFNNSSVNIDPVEILNKSVTTSKSNSSALMKPQNISISHENKRINTKQSKEPIETNFTSPTTEVSIPVTIHSIVSNTTSISDSGWQTVAVVKSTLGGVTKSSTMSLPNAALISTTTLLPTVLNTEVVTSTSLEVSHNESNNTQEGNFSNNGKDKHYIQINNTDGKGIDSDHPEMDKVSENITSELTTETLQQHSTSEETTKSSTLEEGGSNFTKINVQTAIPVALLTRVKVSQKHSSDKTPVVTRRQPKMTTDNSRYRGSESSEHIQLILEEIFENLTTGAPSFLLESEALSVTPKNDSQPDLNKNSDSQSIDLQKTFNTTQVSTTVPEVTTKSIEHENVEVNMNFTITKVSKRVNVSKKGDVTTSTAATSTDSEPYTIKDYTINQALNLQNQTEYNKNNEKSFNNHDRSENNATMIEHLRVLNAISKFAKVQSNSPSTPQRVSISEDSHDNTSLLNQQNVINNTNDSVNEVKNSSNRAESDQLSIKAVASNSSANYAVFSLLTKTYNKAPVDKTHQVIQGHGSHINSTECPVNRTLRCGDGECISAMSRCNQLVDCNDGADERDCSCADYLRAQFLMRKLCDGVVDCWDYTDENNCEWCSPGQFVCPNSQVCVDQQRLCDGARDCPYGDDERQCVTVAQTEANAGDFPYHSEGFLMVRKQGRWGKLCLQNFENVVARSQATWEVSDLGRAVCKAMTYSDFERVDRMRDTLSSSRSHGSLYYELTYASANNNSDTSPRSGLAFRPTDCARREVVHVSCQDLECGVRPQAVNQWARIVGGGNAGPGSWPWQAALYKEGEFQCGATLISQHWLVSAGHCFYHALDDYWVARLGALRRGTNFPSPYEQQRPISRIVLHPGYIDTGFINDISLLRMRDPVSFSDYVRPICLPRSSAELRDGRLCTVVGWGQLFEVGRIFPDTLQEVQLPVISTMECRKRTLFLPLYRVTDNMFCAGFDRGGRDACLGDSGGPLMCQEPDGHWSLYGVTSNGYGCARANRPGVYTKVGNYLPWIHSSMSQPDLISRNNKTACKGHRCPLGECLPKSRVCNGFMECSDGSDEKGCWGESKPTSP